MPEVESVNSNKAARRTVRKIRPKAVGGRAKIIKVRYLIAALALLGATLLPQQIVQAEACPDVRVVFARGSGGER